MLADCIFGAVKNFAFLFTFASIVLASRTAFAADTTSAVAERMDTAAVLLFFSERGLHIDSCENQSLYFEIYKWMGTPYRYGGNTEKGLDCSGFSKKIYEVIYGQSLSGSSRDIYYAAKPIDLDFAKEGDLLFFKTRKGKISHVGIYLSNGKFAHASTSSGVIISDLSETYYQRTFYGAAQINNR